MLGAASVGACGGGPGGGAGSAVSPVAGSATTASLSAAAAAGAPVVFAQSSIAQPLADGAPALVLRSDLGVRVDPGTRVEGFAITRHIWQVTWAEVALAAPGPAGRVALAITASHVALPAEALDTRALGPLSSTPRPAAT